MQILLTVSKVVWNEKHLRADSAMQGEFVVVALHQAALANSGECLQRRYITWPLG